MLVRYRMNSSCSLANMRSDIDSIIRGTATFSGGAPTNLSAGCDTGNTIAYGTYPTGKYSRVGTSASADTYSKIHSDYNDVTHYMRLTYDASTLASFTMSQSYTAGTDTLVNSSEIKKYKNIGFINASFNGTVMTVNNYSPANAKASYLLLGYLLQPGDVIFTHYDDIYQTGGNLSNTEVTNSAQLVNGTTILSQLTGTTGQLGTYQMNTTNTTLGNTTYWSVWRPVSGQINVQPYNNLISPYGIDIIVSTKMLYISSPYNGTHIGMFDIGKNGVSRIYTSNMLMAGVALNNDQFGITIPYTYRFNTNSYSAQAGIAINAITPSRKYDASGALVVIENPTFVYQDDNGNVLSVIYGLLKLPENVYGASTTYADAGSIRRLTLNDYTILTE